MAQVPQTLPKVNYLTDAIQELTEAENTEFMKIIQHPVIIKYFRAVGMRAMFAQAAIPVEEMYQSNNNIKFLLDIALQKGIMQMADTILNHTLVKDA